MNEIVIGSAAYALRLEDFRHIMVPFTAKAARQILQRLITDSRVHLLPHIGKNALAHYWSEGMYGLDARTKRDLATASLAYQRARLGKVLLTSLAYSVSKEGSDGP